MAFEESERRVSHLLTPELRRRLKDMAHRPASTVGRAIGEIGSTSHDFEAALDGRETSSIQESAGGRNAFLEAIILRVGRPSFLITDGRVDWTTGEDFEDGISMADLRTRADQLSASFLAIGRVDTVNHPSMDWLGTCWLLQHEGRPIAVTNRHVAEVFATNRPGGRVAFRTDPGSMVRLGARIDFRHEHATAAVQQAEVSAVRYLARDSDPDVAILEIDGVHLAAPLPLSEEEASAGDLICTVGYPAYDSRNAADAQTQIFRDVYDLKRFAPGRIRQASGPGRQLLHDASTLGGASGSPVMDLQSGAVVGLHFSGQYLKRNVAVSVSSVRDAVQGRTFVAMAPGAGEEGRADGATPPEHFAGREGYRPEFLSEGVDPRHRTDSALLAPLPSPPMEDLARLISDPDDPELRYTHFSVLYDRHRRTPRLTAVNIDGSAPFKIKRGEDKWNKDLRIDPDLQLGSADFPGDFDRGHMVRREDPNWGLPDEARLADADTFHYTNAALQHASLNRSRQRWLGLEEYILRSAQTHGLRACVFSGPVLDDADPAPTDRPDLQVPRAFWKVVVMVAAGSERLHATGYVLGQAEFIQSATETFAFSDFNLYQVPIAKVAAATSIDFHGLEAFDPMVEVATTEARLGGANLVTDLEDIRL